MVKKLLVPLGSINHTGAGEFKVTPDRWQSKTLLTVDEHGSNIARNSVFDCHFRKESDKWQSKNLFLMIYSLLSLIVLKFSITTYQVCYHAVAIAQNSLFPVDKEIN